MNRVTADMLAHYLLTECAPRETFVVAGEVPEDAPDNTISLEAVLEEIGMEPERFEEGTR